MRWTMPAANGAKGNPASKRMMNASKKAKRVKNKAKNMRVHGKVVKMHTEMAKMIDSGFRAGVV